MKRGRAAGRPPLDSPSAVSRRTAADAHPPRNPLSYRTLKQSAQSGPIRSGPVSCRSKHEQHSRLPCRQPAEILARGYLSRRSAPSENPAAVYAHLPARFPARECRTTRDSNKEKARSPAQPRPPRAPCHAADAGHRNGDCDAGAARAQPGRRTGLIPAPLPPTQHGLSAPRRLGHSGRGQRTPAARA
jgi:hypothetical protein